MQNDKADKPSAHGVKSKFFSKRIEIDKPDNVEEMVKDWLSEHRYAEILQQDTHTSSVYGGGGYCGVAISIWYREPSEPQ